MKLARAAVEVHMFGQRRSLRQKQMCLSVGEGPLLNALGFQGHTIGAERIFTQRSKRLINSNLEIIEGSAVFAYECVREFWRRERRQGGDPASLELHVWGEANVLLHRAPNYPQRTPVACLLACSIHPLDVVGEGGRSSTPSY